MSFYDDSLQGLRELATEVGDAATWTNSVKDQVAITGVFNQAALAKEFQDAGILSTYDAAFVCDRDQFEPDQDGNITLPAIGETLLIDGTTYRIESINKDSVSLDLRLKTP